MALRAATQETLRADWLGARDAIERLRQRQKSRWLTEDVYHLLRSGVATLWVHEAHGGGYVTLPQIEAFTGRRVLTVWLGWRSGDKTTLGDDAEALRVIAAAQHCEAVTFVSERRGWEKRAQNIGFSFRESTYEAPAMTQEIKR